MNEIITTKSFEDLSALAFPEVIKEYEKDVKCWIHGTYKAKVTVFSNGSEVVSDCPLCTKEAEEQEQKQIEIKREQSKLREEENYKICSRKAF